MIFGVPRRFSNSQVALCGTMRSHPALVELPSQLIYGDKLEALASAAERSSLLNALRFPNEKLPWALVNIAGGEQVLE